MFQQNPRPKGKTSSQSLIHGAGINDAWYVVAYKDAAGRWLRCPYYGVWAGMVERCYSKKLQERRPTYKGCTLDPSWHHFSNFRSWMVTQDHQNKVLDKDLLAQGIKHYGPDTCLFISKELNNLLCLRQNHRGKYPLGVSETTINGITYLTASCSFYGKQKRLGYFKTADEAAACYQKAKQTYIKELAAAEKNPRVKQALLNIG